MPDRIYSVSYNGRIYDVRAPENADPTTIFAFVQQQAGGAQAEPQQKGVVEDYLEEVPLIGGLLTGVADIGLGAVQGVAGGIGAATEAFGADTSVSNFFDDIAKGAGDLISAEEKGDLAAGQRALKEAEDKGILEQVKAAAYAFSKSPLTLTAQALGSVAPVAAATVATGGAGGAALAAAMGAGAVKGGIYDAVEEAAIEKGIDPKAAKAMADEAQSYLGENVDQVALGAVLGAIAGRFGLEPAIARVVGKELAERSVLSRMGRGLAAEAVPEAGQAAQQRMAQNIALQREGYDVPTMRGVAGQAALEGIMGGVPGAALGIFDGKGPTPSPDTELESGRAALEGVLEDEAATPEARDEALSARVRQLEAIYGDPDFALELAEAERADIEAQRAAKSAAKEPDVGGREPDVSGVGEAVTDEEPAAAPAAVEPGPVGGTVIPPVSPQRDEGVVEPSLKPDAVWANKDFDQPVKVMPVEPQAGPDGRMYQSVIVDGTPSYVPADELRPIQAAPTVEAAPVAPPPIVPPIETVTPEAQFAQQMAEIAPAPAPIKAAIDAVPEPKATRQAAADIEQYVTEKRTTKAAAAQEKLALGEQPTLTERVALRQEERIAQGLPARLTPEERAAPAEVAEPAPVAEAPKIEQPAEVRDLQTFVDEYRPGFEVRFNPELKTRPYSYGIPGQKALGRSTSAEGLRKQILNEAPLKPTETVEGVPVKKMPPGKAKGVEETQPLSRQAFGEEYEDPSGKLNVAQQEQVDLLMNEIDTARRMREITDGERTQLVDMLRTPTGKDLLRSPTWRVASNLQGQIDQLTKRGRELSKTQKEIEKTLGQSIFAKGAKLTPEARRLKTEITDISKTTKSLGTKLLEQKSGIYDAARSSLDKMRSERAAGIEAVQQRRAQAKRNVAKGYIDEATYKRIMRETENELRQLRPEAARYRKGRNKAAGISLEAMNDIVKSITSRWKVPLEPKMVQSVEDLPDAIRAELEADDRTDAFGFLKDGTVYLIADNMNSANDVAPTLFHEALGHLGLRRAFREGLDDVLNDIYRSNKKVADAVDEWVKANPDAYASDEDPLARAVEEVLAEASEGGPMSASKFDRLVKFFKDAIRQVFGIDLKLSDGEVRTILAMAHEQAMEGAGPAVGSSAAVYSKPTQEENDAQADVLNASEETTTGMDKIQMSADRIDEEAYRRGAFAGLKDAMNARTAKDWIGSLKPSRIRKQFIAGGGLGILPTDGLLDYAETLLGASNPTIKAMREAADNMDRLNATRSTMRRALSKTVRDLKDFITTHGNNVLGDTMYYGNYFNIDMTKFKDGMSNEDAYKTDGVWRRYTKLLQNPNLDADKRKDYTAKLEQRQVEIREGMQAWSELGKLKGGQNLYERVRNMHRDMYNTRRYLIKTYIENLKDAGVSEETVSKMMKSYQEQYERLNNVDTAPEADEAHKDYPEVPLGLFHREYFPKRRFGSYWLRMKKTKVGEPVLQFYTSMAERDAALASFAEEMGFDPDKASSNVYYDIGNDAQRELSGEFEGVNTNTAFNRALNILSGIDPENFTEATKQKLQADVYQLFLMSSPEGAVGKQFIKSKNRLGWSQDILQIVGATAEEYAGDISRLRYGQKVDQALINARSSTDSVPRAEKAMASDFINELEKRVQGEMQPQAEGLANKIVPWMNQFAFVSFLTAPATALVQITALPIRVAPHLWGKYGLAASSKAMARYSNVFNNLPKLESQDEKSKSFRIATLRESNVVKNSKRHQDALRRATDEFGIIKPLSEFTMHEERTPETAAQGKRAETVTKAYDAMTYLFDTTEQLTREVAFLAAYDLEYAKLTEQGVPEADRQMRAVLAAKDSVNYTLGNYSNFNRPSVMKGSELAKAVFLFKQYSVVTTRFFFTSMRTIFGKNVPKEVRTAAMKEATGVLGMSFLFGGVVGLPLYSLGMMALQALQDATDDDEDRRERMLQNPMTADSVEMQFRYEWLPQHFGPPTIIGKGDKSYSLSDIILNGPVSEISGWNFGSRVSIDFLGLWFRAPKDADTWTGTVNNLLVENIPGASASLNMVAMGEEFSKGNIADGLQVGLPAAVRGMVKAYNLGTEGLRTKSEKIRMRAEDIENSELVGTVLGFNPTRVAKVQQQTRDILGRTKELQETERNLLSNYTRAVRRIRNGDADGYADASKAMREIEEYNQKIGNPYLAITYTNIMNSLRGAVSEEKYDVQGMGLNEIESYYAQKTIEGR